MKRPFGCCRRRCWIALALCLGMVNVADAVEDDKHVSSDPASAPIQILVTYRDERAGRVSLGDSVNLYRRRGKYGNSTWSERVAEALAKDHALKQVAQWPITALDVHCVVYELSPRQSLDQVLQELKQDRRVEAAQPMQQFHSMSETYTDPYYKLQSGFKAMNLGEVHHLATGRDVTVAVIDTGVDTNHPDLKGQLFRSENFVPAQGAGTEEMHGTAIAGIISAAANNGRGIVGIAPQAKLISLKACWQESPQQPEANCSTFTLALALNTAIQLKAQVINMSLAGPSDPLLARLIEKAVADGVVVVVSQPAQLESANSFPSSLVGVIPVRTAQAQASGLKDGQLSIAAPGVDVLTTLPRDSYNFMTGSSFAAAHVSGLIALLLELNPKLNTSQLISIFQLAQSRDLPHTVDAAAAVASVQSIH